MQDVNITTNTDLLQIQYGMINFGEERPLARNSVKYIYSDLNSIRTDYIRLGFHLSEFENQEYYKDFGFSTFSEFVEKNIPMDKGTVSRCINVFREFCEKRTDYSGTLISRSNCLDNKYKEYSYSQLCEMLSMTEETRQQIKPEMTVKQIREIKKADKNVSREKENVSQVAMSQPEKEEKPKKDLSKVATLHGSALQSFVKSLKPDDLINNKSVVLYIFDSNGKPLPFEFGFNCWGKEIYHDTKDGKNDLYIILSCAFPEDKEGGATND